MKAMNDPIASIGNRGTDYGLESFDVDCPDDDYSTVEGYDGAARDDLLYQILDARHVRGTYWAEGRGRDDQTASVRLAESGGAWWAIWEDASYTFCEAYETRDAAEAVYAQWTVDASSLTMLGPPTHTDVDSVDTLPDGMKVVRDEDGDLVIVPIVP